MVNKNEWVVRQGKGSYNGEIPVVLSHYPMRAWNKSHHGSLNLFGHVHCRKYDTSQSVDVGVDSWDFYPITLDQAMERMKESPEYITPNYD